MKWKPRRAAAERAKNEASFWPGLSLRSNRKIWKKSWPRWATSKNDCACVWLGSFVFSIVWSVKFHRLDNLFLGGDHHFSTTWNLAYFENKCSQRQVSEKLNLFRGNVDCLGSLKPENSGKRCVAQRQASRLVWFQDFIWIRLTSIISVDLT